MAGLPLVTGAAGFAGSHLVEHLLASEPSVAAWTNPGGRAPAADPRVQHRAVDVLDRDGMLRAFRALRPSVVYHCAGVAHVGGSWSAPERALEVNALGTHRLLDALRDAGLEIPVLLTGSALVYRASAEAIDETHPIQPATPYGLSKLAQEMVAAHTPGVPVFLARPFNHAGPRQSEAFVTSSFARQIAEIEAGLRPPVLAVGNLDARRDLTDVRDTVEAYRLIVERGTPGRPYNVCSGRAWRIRDLLDTMIGMARVAIEVQVDPDRLRPSDHPVVLGSHSRLTEDTGWRPAIPVERTLADVLTYWRDVTARR